jgi:hypothetical protein
VLQSDDNGLEYNVTCILIARQRLTKHIPAEANAWNRTSLARQQHAKIASSTIEAVFSV